MKGQNVGYKRVSSLDQNTDRQLIGVDLDEVFSEKRSGKNTNRPALEKCLKHLREHDVLHVHSIDRLARNLKDLQEIVERLVKKGVTVKFHKENLIFDGSSSAPMQTLMFQMMGAFAEFERTLIRERQKEGIEAAKARGQKFGAPPKLDADQVALLREKLAQCTDKSKLAKEFGISRPTLYKLMSQPI